MLEAGDCFLEIICGVVDPFGDKGFDDGGLDSRFVVKDHGRVGGSLFGERRLDVFFESQGFFLAWMASSRLDQALAQIFLSKPNNSGMRQAMWRRSPPGILPGS